MYWAMMGLVVEKTTTKTCPKTIHTTLMIMLTVPALMLKLEPARKEHTLQTSNHCAPRVADGLMLVGKNHLPLPWSSAVADVETDLGCWGRVPYASFATMNVVVLALIVGRVWSINHAEMQLDWIEVLDCIRVCVLVLGFLQAERTTERVRQFWIMMMLMIMVG
jgi:hypothetical protein